MNRNKSLEHIANSFHAAGKIQSLRNSVLKEDSRMSVTQDRISLLQEALQVIAEYAPDPHKSALGDTLHRGSVYNNTYRDLKQHFKVVQEQGMNSDHLIRTLDIMKPVLSNRSRNLIEKVMKIYEILNS